MISLRLEVGPLPIDEPQIIRLMDRYTPQAGPFDAFLLERGDQTREYDFAGFSLTVGAAADEDLDGDVLLLLPGQKSAHRLIRSKSDHNTFLVTERCDQLCVMCSQPPKKQHFDMFDRFAEAALLAPQDAYLGISGGEPTLLKERLFEFLLHVSKERPDIRFHVLTNGQHFEAADAQALSEIGVDRVLWGIPLYSSEADQHDKIVGKEGAFHRLGKSLTMLMRIGAAIELRTVVMKQNEDNLPALAAHISTHLPFVTSWALMQMERIGYGRMNWGTSFLDTSVHFERLRQAVNIASGRGINVQLYNFPLCSLPDPYRELAPATISDWKQKYLDFCWDCTARSTCSGFFEWYSHDEGFAGLGPL